LKEPKSNEAYHRVDQAAAWMLQAKLYMNAKVYIGSDNHMAVPLITKITGSNYALHTNYNELFLADNDKNGAQNEFIFAIAFDGIHTQTYGGTTFLTHAPVGSMDASALVSMVDEVSERQQLLLISSVLTQQILVHLIRMAKPKKSKT
jgi:hypothetical protein